MGRIDNYYGYSNDCDGSFIFQVPIAIAVSYYASPILTVAFAPVILVGLFIPGIIYGKTVVG